LRDIPAAQPDLVFMDVNLGRGITGLEVAEQLRLTMDVPIIFLSAYSAAELMAKLPNAGVVAFLSKPLDWNRILPAINELLARVE
jgi:CheY-like chemotaxis protein